jgi:hypothetical protein
MKDGLAASVFRLVGELQLFAAFHRASMVTTEVADGHKNEVMLAIEGQFIFGDSAAVITVKLHAFDGGFLCQVRGTGVAAYTP